MGIRKSFTYVALFIALCSVVAFVFIFIRAVAYVPRELPITPTETARFVASSSNPVRLQIPSLHIDAQVQYVGVTPDGNMGIPDNFKDVAWYQHGTVPGQLGSAVIDGHVDNGLGLRAVFSRLSEIEIGADVFVVARDGATLRFVVSDVRSYPYSNAPLDLIFTRHDAARLNLITCSGTWISSAKTYTDRIVVFTTFAERIPSEM